MKRDNFITIYTKDKGKLELSKEEWTEFYEHSIPLHREDGPAIEYNDGTKFWFLNGRLHRVNGPARELKDGSKSWFIDNDYYSKEEFNQIINEAKALPLELKLTDPRWWVRELK